MRLERFRLLSVTMLFLFIMSLAVTSVKSGDYTATIYVDPWYVHDEAMGSGSTFDLAFKIRDAVDCYSWSMNLSWDPTVLTIIGYTEGDFLVGQPDGSTWNYRFDEMASGWGYIGEMTNGDYYGVDGNGWLLNFTFQVLSDYGHSSLNITQAKTYIMVYPPYPLQREEVNKENGYFSNMILGDIQGNTAGTPPDGDVDRYDFFAFAGCYGSNEGDPNYNFLADLQGNTAGTPPDGDVDRYDFFAFAGNYGRSI